MKNEESHAERRVSVGRKLTGTFSGWSEFLHDVRVEMRQVTWPTRRKCVSTTGVVIVTVAFLWLFFCGCGLRSAAWRSRTCFKVV